MVALMRVRWKAAWVAVGFLIVPLAGCSAGLRAEMAACRSLDWAAASIGPSIRDYHRELISSLGGAEARTITDFVDQLRVDISDPSMLEAHVVRFMTDLDRLRRARAVEEDRYRAAMGQLSGLRRSASRLYRSAEVGTGLQGALRQYTDLFLDAVAPIPTAPPEGPPGC
jgi:hypothetical protein